MTGCGWRDEGYTRNIREDEEESPWLPPDSLGRIPVAGGLFRRAWVQAPRMADIPPGSLELVVSILRSSPGPVRRRKLLTELEAGGHRISLAGLNRIIEHGTRQGRLSDGPDGVRAMPPNA